jgi:hypothetical protein
MERYNSIHHLYSRSSNSKYYFLLFIIWPFGAFLLALTDFKHQVARNVIYFFLVYYGATIAIDPNSYMDAVRYGLKLQANSKLPFSHLYEIIGSFYKTDDTMDIVEQLLSFLLSRITSDQRVLFAAFAAIFGFFYLKSINLLHKEYLKRPSWNALIFLAFFSLLLTVTSINGFRMWTAAWVFIYGAYHVVLKRDTRYFIVALSAILVHWSFVSLNFILVIYYFVGNRDKIYIPLAIASFIIPHLIAPLLAFISLQLGGGFQSRYDMYSDEEYVLGRQEAFEQTAWFMRFGTEIVLYYLVSAIAFIKFKYSHLMQGNSERNLFSFNLLLLTFVNFGKIVPSLGSRFQLLFFLFATMYVFLFFTKYQVKKVSLITLIGLFPMLLNTAIVFRQGSDTINAWLFTPGLGVPLLVPPLSLANLLFN